MINAATTIALAPQLIAARYFRGVNDHERAQQALARWKQEEGARLPPGTKPSREVALRLALVHEFRTRSRVFVCTEAGAKGLNFQFCDTVINYDLPWNPQRIEQRIGRCHRYSQQRDVTVVNFIASDNEAHNLTFEILSQKLDLFGRVLEPFAENGVDILHRLPKHETLERRINALESREDEVYRKWRDEYHELRYRTPTVTTLYPFVLRSDGRRGAQTGPFHKQ